MTEGHFVFGDAKPSASPSPMTPASGPPASAGSHSGPPGGLGDSGDVWSEMLGALDGSSVPGVGADGLTDAQRSTRAEATLVHDAPGVLAAYDILQGVDAQDPRVRQLVREAVNRGIMDGPGFRGWVAGVKDAATAAGYRVSLDSLIYYLEAVNDARRRFATQPARLQ